MQPDSVWSHRCHQVLTRTTISYLHYLVSVFLQLKSFEIPYLVFILKSSKYVILLLRILLFSVPLENGHLLKMVNPQKK